MNCGNIVTTTEAPDLSKSVLVRHPSIRKLHPFSRDKLFVSILESCGHRAQAFAEAAALTETIIAQLLQNIADGVIERQAIVQTAKDTLARFDPVAVALYTAYHNVDENIG